MDTHVQALLTRIIETVHYEGYPNIVQELTGPIYKQFGFYRPVPKEVLAYVGNLFSTFRGKVRPSMWLRSRSDLLQMIAAIQEDYKRKKASQMIPPSAPSSQYVESVSAPPSQMMDFSEASQLPEPTYINVDSASVFVKEEEPEEECPIWKWNKEKEFANLKMENEQLKEEVERLRTNSQRMVHLITQKEVELMSLREQTAGYWGNDFGM